jgi:anti-sigma B factor antagonist
VPHLAIRSRAPDAERSAPPPLTIDDVSNGGVRILALSGELDLSTAGSLCVVLHLARREPRPRVLVDLSGLEFCDSSGLRALIGAAQEIVASGGRLAVVVPDGQSAVARLLDVCGLREHLRVYGGARDALAALGRPR